MQAPRSTYVFDTPNRRATHVFYEHYAFVPIRIFDAVPRGLGASVDHASSQAIESERQIPREESTPQSPSDLPSALDL